MSFTRNLDVFYIFGKEEMTSRIKLHIKIIFINQLHFIFIAIFKNEQKLKTSKSQ